MKGRKEYIDTFLLFLIWPIASLVLLSTRGGSSNVKIFVIFLLYFFAGMNFSISLESFDSFRYVHYLESMENTSFSMLIDDVLSTFKEGGSGRPDFFQTFLHFIISRFTVNSRVLFTIYGLIMAFSFSIFLNKIKTISKDKLFSEGMAILFLFLILYLPFRLNSFRHYLGGLYFLYFVINYAQKGTFLSLLKILPVAFIHFGYLTVYPLIVLHFLVGLRYLIYYCLMFVAIIFKDASVVFFSEASEEVVESAGKIGEVASAYSNDSSAKKYEMVKESSNSILRLYAYWTAIGLLIISIISHYSINDKNLFRNSLYAVILSFSSLILFTVEMPVINNRFSVIFSMLCLVYLILAERSKRIHKFIRPFFYLIIALNTVICMRLFIETFSLSYLLPFFPLNIFYVLDLTMFSLVRFIFE